MAESLYLLDAYSLLFQVFHAIPGMTGPKGQPTNAVYGFTGDLLRLRKKQPDYLICVFDAPGKTFRDDIYDQYKAQRKPMPDELCVQLPVLDRVLEAFRIPVIRVPGVEADDAIATLARLGEERAMDVTIFSGDKDCRQLITDRVKLCNIRKDTIMDRAALQADWGITPEQVVDLLTMVGDNVDNVPGVPGVGIKTAQKLLQEFGTLESIYENLDKIKGKKTQESFKASVDLTAQGRKLITLERHVAISADWAGWRLQSANVPGLLDLFTECGFHRFANEVREEVKVVATQPAAGQQASLFGSGWEGDYQLVDTPEKFEKFFNKLAAQKRFAIDLETTSLIAHDAEIVGYAISWQAGEAYYLAVRGPSGATLLDPKKTLERLRPILESPDIAKINQNIKYDFMVLLNTGVRLAGINGDSMIASYLLTSGERNHNLDELSLRYLGHQPIPITDLIGKTKPQKRMDEVEPARIAEYAGEDADIAWRLAELLEPKLTPLGLAELYRNLEIPLVEVLGDLEYTGIKVDVPLLERLSKGFAEQLERIEKEIYALAGHSFNIGSPKQLRQVLFDELKLPKYRKTGITGEASTGQDVLEELAAAGHELPRKISEYRQLAKLKGTYVDALPALVNAKSGRIHASLNQTVAATGRLSSSDPNLQNIPVRSEQGRQIRQAFIAGEPGWLILAADYSQIELRILAHYSQDEELRQAFAADRDIHAHVASQIYGIPEAEVSSEQRRNAKTVNFGVIYGLSAFGLAARLGMTKEAATEFIDAYFARYPGVQRFQEKVLDSVRRDGYVSTILGRRRAIEGVRGHSSYRQRNQPEREALNSVIQGSAADLIKQAMLNIQRRLRREGFAARMLLQIHDELLFESPPAELATLAKLVDREMTGALALDVPNKVEIAAGPNWLDVEPIEA